MGSVSVMVYLYAKHGLGWAGFRSFLVALLVATYFVSLRNSWDLYAQSFGLLFLFATLIVLKSTTNSWRYPLAFSFMVLTVMSHELVSVILFFILGLEVIRLLIKNNKHDYAFLFVSLAFMWALFILRQYSFETGIVFIPSAVAVSESSFASVSLVSGLLFYCYVLLLPLVILGLLHLKDWFIRAWASWCMLALLLIIIFPNLPLFYWNRWVYLLVYPLLFLAVEGLAKLWQFCSGNAKKIRRLIPKAVAITYIALLLALSGFYLTASPESQISFFSSNNPYLSFIPSSMLQNTLPINENPSLVACFDWINNNGVNNSSVVIHYALYNLAAMYVIEKSVIPVNHNPSMNEHLQNESSLLTDIIDTSRDALAAGSSTVYTVWWVNGDGWYKISSLSYDFKELYRSGGMAVYVFNSPE